MRLSWEKHWRPKAGPKVRPYMTDKSNIAKLIVFTAVFSIAFINLYKPYFLDIREDISTMQYLVYSCVVIFTGIFVLAVSRYFMYWFVQKFSLYYTEYIIWIFLEIVALSGFYTWFIIFLRTDLHYWNVGDIITVFREVNINTLLVIFIPYSVSWLYLSNSDKKKQLVELQKSGIFRNGPSVLQFKDEKGVAKFSVAFENVIYIESADNYLEVNYLNNDKISKYLIRNSMKRMEVELEKTAIKRCHRSYMVNFEHVTALRKNNDEIGIEFDVPDIKKIPISKTYADAASNAFLLFSGQRKSFVSANQ